MLMRIVFSLAVVTSMILTANIAGECDKVSIVASGVEVYIAKANVVEIIGDNTTVTVETRLKELYAVGDGNTVILADVESVHVNGDRNRINATTAAQVGGVGTGNSVRWLEGDPLVEFPVPGNTYGKAR
jgi:hypothetical protein